MIQRRFFLERLCIRVEKMLFEVQICAMEIFLWLLHMKKAITWWENIPNCNSYSLSIAIHNKILFWIKNRLSSWIHHQWSTESVLYMDILKKSYLLYTYQIINEYEILYEISIKNQSLFFPRSKSKFLIYQWYKLYQTYPKRIKDIVHVLLLFYKTTT